METVLETNQFILEKNSSNEFFIKTKTQPQTVVRFNVLDSAIRFCTNGYLTSRTYGGSSGFVLDKDVK